MKIVISYRQATCSPGNNLDPEAALCLCYSSQSSCGEFPVYMVRVQRGWLPLLSGAFRLKISCKVVPNAFIQTIESASFNYVITKAKFVDAHREEFYWRH